jgi:hypothetical protein
MRERERERERVRGKDKVIEGMEKSGADDLVDKERVGPWSRRKLLRQPKYRNCT